MTDTRHYLAMGVPIIANAPMGLPASKSAWSGVN